MSSIHIEQLQINKQNLRLHEIQLSFSNNTFTNYWSFYF